MKIGIPDSRYLSALNKRQFMHNFSYKNNTTTALHTCVSKDILRGLGIVGKLRYDCSIDVSFPSFLFFFHSIPVYYGMGKKTHKSVQ